MRKCKPNCRYQMLETYTGDHSASKYVCDLYEQDLDYCYPNLYRCNEFVEELEQLEIIDDTKNV